MSDNHTIEFRELGTELSLSVDNIEPGVSYEAASSVSEDGLPIEILSGLGLGSLNLWVTVDGQITLQVSLEPLFDTLVRYALTAYHLGKDEESES